MRENEVVGKNISCISGEKVDMNHERILKGLDRRERELEGGLHRWQYIYRTWLPSASIAENKRACKSRTMGSHFASLGINPRKRCAVLSSSLQSNSLEQASPRRAMG